MRVTALVSSVVLALGLTLAQNCARAATADEVKNYPVRPVRLILASGPGSSPDVIGRMVANKLSEAWGHSVVVDNRPGATGLIAVELLSRSAPDGYTVGMFTMTNLIAMLMYQKYMLASELSAVTLVGTTPFAIVVNAKTPVKNLAEFIAYAKARPGQLRYGSTGMWGSLHMCMEEILKMTGMQMTHVPYKSAVPVMNDLIAGDIHVFCPAAPMLGPYIKAGKIRLLGETYKETTKLLPGVPPVAETVPGFALYGWYGMHAPRGTPPAIIQKINAEVVKALKDPKLAQIMLITGAEAVGSSPEEYAKWLQKDEAYWTRLLTQSGANLGKPMGKH